MTDPLTSNERAISHERLQFLIRFAESYNATPGHPWADILFALKEYQTMFGSSPDEASNAASVEVRRFRPWPQTEDYAPASDYERLRLERDQWKNRADALEPKDEPTFTEIDFLANSLYLADLRAQGRAAGTRWWRLQEDLRTTWRAEALRQYMDWAMSEQDAMERRAAEVERIPSNLVSKLREFHWYGPPVKGIDALLNEAADEVERLNALAGPSGKSLGELEAINDSLLEENERLRGSVPGVETREDRPVLVACPVCGKMDPECDEPGKCPYGPKAAKGEIKLLRQWVEDRDQTIAHWVTENRRLGVELARRRADLDDPPADIQERVLRKVGLWPTPSPVESSALQVTAVEFHAHEGEPLRAEARYQGEAVKLFAASVVQWFKDEGGENFATVELVDGLTRERYSITMQNALGKTPAQELSELRAALKAAAPPDCGDACDPSP
jgi:hypothetical protein